MSWILVNELGRFWDGRRWVREYPDAARYSGFPTVPVVPPGAIAVRDYGDSLERRVRTARSECPECGSTGPHEDNDGGSAHPRISDLTFLCECGSTFDAELPRER